MCVALSISVNDTELSTWAFAILMSFSQSRLNILPLGSSRIALRFFLGFIAKVSECF